MPPKKQSKPAISQPSLGPPRLFCTPFLFHKYHDISCLLRKYIQYTNFASPHTFFYKPNPRRIPTQYLITFNLKAQLIRPNFNQFDLKCDEYFKRNKLTNRLFSSRDLLYLYSNLLSPLKVVITSDRSTVRFFSRIFKKFKNIKHIFGHCFYFRRHNGTMEVSKILQQCFRNFRAPKIVNFESMGISPAIRFLRKPERIIIESELQNAILPSFEKSIYAGIVRTLSQTTYINLSSLGPGFGNLHNYLVPALLKKINTINHLSFKQKGRQQGLSEPMAEALAEKRKKFETLNLSFGSVDEEYKGEDLGFLVKIEGLRNLGLTIEKMANDNKLVWDVILDFVSKIDTLDTFKLIHKERYYWSEVPAPVVEMTSGRNLALKISPNQDLEKLKEIVEKWPMLSSVTIKDSKKDSDITELFSWFGILISKKDLREFEIELYVSELRNVVKMNGKREISATLTSISLLSDAEEMIISKIPTNCKLTKLEFKPRVFDQKLTKFLDNLRNNTKIDQFFIDLRDEKKITDALLKDLEVSLSAFNLSEIEVKIDNSSKFTNLGLESIQKSLCKMKSLKKLYLSLTQCPQLSDEVMFQTFVNIDIWPELTDFKLECFVNNHITLQNKRDLTLLFKSNYSLTIDGLQTIGKGISKLDKLENFEINFAESTISDDELKAFLESIRENFENLQKLRIFLRFCKKLKQDYAKSLAAFLKQKKFLILDILYLHLPEKTSNKGLEQISATLPTTIKTLEFEVYIAKEITSEGLQFLSNSIKKPSFTNLRELTLGFSEGSKFTDKEASVFGELVMNNPAISSLSLAFVQCLKMGDDAIKLLLAPISTKNLPDLSKLFLKFHFIGNLSNFSCKYFAEMFTRIPTVQKMSLLFDNNRAITNAGIEIFSEGLVHDNFPKLEYLKLWICNFNEINDFSVKYLTLAISTLTTLKELDFGFNNADITEKGERCVVVNFSGLKVKKLDVAFSCKSENYYSRSNHLEQLTKRFNGESKSYYKYNYE